MGSVIIDPTPRGAVVLIPEDLNVNTGAAKTSAIEILSFVQNKSSELFSKNEAIQQALMDLGQNFNIPDISVKTANVSVNPVTYPSARDWGELVLNTAWPRDLPIKPSLDDFGDIDFSFIEPVPPAEFNASFSWVGSEYSSEIRTALAAAIYNELVNGGYGLPLSVHHALIEKEQNARLRNQSMQVREALNATGNTGFILGMGSPAQKGILAEVTTAQIHSDQDALNAITDIDFKIYQQNKEFFHSLALEFEKMQSGEWDRFEQRNFEAGRAEFEFAIKAIEVSLEVYLKKWDGIKIKSETLQVKIEAIATKNKSRTDQYIAEYEAYKTRVEAIGAENTSKVQIRGIEVETWAKEVSAVAQADSSMLARAEFEYKQLITEVENELKAQGINIEGYKAEGELRSAILEAIAKITAQVTASTIGAMNASANLGFSGSEAVHRSLSETVNLGESYSATLTPGA